MDGKVKEYPTRHLARTLDHTYRLTFKDEEIDFPLCNVRTIRTLIDPQKVEPGDAIIDGDQKWVLTNPLKKAHEIKMVDHGE